MSNFLWLLVCGFDIRRLRDLSSHFFNLSQTFPGNTTIITSAAAWHVSITTPPTLNECFSLAFCFLLSNSTTYSIIHCTFHFSLEKESMPFFCTFAILSHLHSFFFIPNPTYSACFTLQQYPEYFLTITAKISKKNACLVICNRSS